MESSSIGRQPLKESLKTASCSLAWDPFPAIVHAIRSPVQWRRNRLQARALEALVIAPRYLPGNHD